MNIKKNLKIIKPDTSKRLICFAINFIVMLISSISLYFVCLYGIFNTVFNYNDNKIVLKEKKELYGLNLNDKQDYKAYEEKIDEFYFVTFKDELLTYYQSVDKNIESIEHAYNVFVLHLPISPTVDYYQTDFYKYKQESGGTFNVNVKAIRIEGSGSRYEANLKSLFYQTYSDLPKFTNRFDNEFYLANKENTMYEEISRSIAFIIPYLINYIILPLINKDGTTLIEKKFNIGRVERKRGYRIKWYQTLIRNILAFILPFIGFLYFNLYSVVILIILPIFINILFMIINKNNYELLDYFVYTESVDLSNSLVFNNTKEEYEYYKLNKDVYSEEYTPLLENVEELDLTTSRDEKIKKDSKIDWK